MSIQPYIFLNGRCDEAITFYCKAIDAEEVFKMRYEDAPEDPGRPLPPAYIGKVMHASLAIGNNFLLLSDGRCDEAQISHSGFSLSIGAKDLATCQRYFDGLAQGGSITMPFQKTFWTEGFGMLVDQFGISWMVTVEAGEPG